MANLKPGTTLYVQKKLNIILYLHFTQQRQLSAEVWPNIQYSFGDDGQIVGFGQIVKSDLRHISNNRWHSTALRWVPVKGYTVHILNLCAEIMPISIIRFGWGHAWEPQDTTNDQPKALKSIGFLVHYYSILRY